MWRLTNQRRRRVAPDPFYMATKIDRSQTIILLVSGSQPIHTWKRDNARCVQHNTTNVQMPMLENNHNNVDMNEDDANTFLFTSESVGEGHPGKQAN